MANGTWNNVPVGLSQMGTKNIKSITVGNKIYTLESTNSGTTAYLGVLSFDTGAPVYTTQSFTRPSSGIDWMGGLVYDPINNKLIILDFGGGSSLSRFCVYNIVSNTFGAWTSIVAGGASAPTAGDTGYVSYYNEKVFHFYGTGIYQYVVSASGTVLTCSSFTNTSATIGAMDVGITSGCTVGDKVYICSGSGSNQRISIYNMSTGALTFSPNNSTAKALINTVLFNLGSYIYCSGTTFSPVDNTMRIYDINNNTWTTGTSIGAYHFETTASVYKNAAYIFGGRTESGGTSYTTNILSYQYNTAAPSGVSASLVGNNVRLTWVDNSDEEDCYIIERKASDEVAFTQITANGLLPSGTTSYTDLTSDASTASYIYKIKARKISL